MSPPEQKRDAWVPAKGLAALLLTGMLVVFLVAIRQLGSARIPEETIRVVELAPEMALPAPPPPPPDLIDEPPPPPQRMQLPQLDLQMDMDAPALKATLDVPDLTMETAMFELEVDPPPVAPPVPQTQEARPAVGAPRPAPVARTTFDVGELDSKPRLRNAPSTAYPRELLQQGIREGRVIIEVEIDTNGNTSVRRVISSNHPRFSEIARGVAGRARFTTPTKNGRPVKAIFRWPILMRP
ncbi:MAG: energy transducer TonB [Verrucomicrobiota bacterium]